MVRGEVFRLSIRGPGSGHAQAGPRYGVVVQSDSFLGLSTVLVAPTSTAARAASFRPVIDMNGTSTRVLVEQTTAVDVRHLGDSAGRLDADELRGVNDALARVLGF